MLLPVTMSVPLVPVFWAASVRVVEPVCPTPCDCQDFPPVNPFALPPPPFAKFLERQNIIDRFQTTPPAPLPHAKTYGQPKTDTAQLGNVLDVRA